MTLVPHPKATVSKLSMWLIVSIWALDIKIFLGDDDEEDQVEVIDEEIEELATEENQVTVTGDDSTNHRVE